MGVPLRGDSFFSTNNEQETEAMRYCENGRFAGLAGTVTALERINEDRRAARSEEERDRCDGRHAELAKGIDWKDRPQAWRVWNALEWCARRRRRIFTVTDTLLGGEIGEFLSLLDGFGIREFVYECRSTATLEFLYGCQQAGWKAAEFTKSPEISPVTGETTGNSYGVRVVKEAG